MVYPIKLIIIIGILIFVGLLINTFYNRKKNLTIQFSGIVDDVHYDVKGIPFVSVGGKEYYLSSGYYIQYKIEKGDSLIKEKNSNEYKLIKRNTREVTIFKN